MPKSIEETIFMLQVYYNRLQRAIYYAILEGYRQVMEKENKDD